MTVPRVISKSDQVRMLLRENREIDALRIAKSFRMLGEHKVAIQRAWDAYTNPGFHRQIQRDPDRLLSDGIAALREMYG